MTAVATAFTPAPRSAALWRLNAFSALHWLDWDAAEDFHVVHDTGSGRTHFLTPLGAWLLRRLEAAPADVACLGVALRADCDDPLAPGLDAALADAIELLAAELLIEPGPSIDPGPGASPCASAS